jgi:hypothetical protein
MLQSRINLEGSDIMNPWDDGYHMIKGFTRSSHRIYHNGLIHEHEFVPRRLKGSYHLRICCTTCRKCYCYLCGKLLEKDTAEASLNDPNSDI